MLIATLLDLVPEKGELKITLTRRDAGARLALIPTPGKLTTDDTNAELQARQAALVSPIVLDFSIEDDEPERALAQTIAEFRPAVTDAANQLANYTREQEKRAAEAAEAAKAAKTKTAAKKAAAKKVVTKKSEPATPEKKPDSNGDLFSTGPAGASTQPGAGAPSPAATAARADNAATAPAAGDPS